MYKVHVADARIGRETRDELNGGSSNVGYDINFNRVCFQYQPLHPPLEVDAVLATVEKRILALY